VIWAPSRVRTWSAFLAVVDLERAGLLGAGDLEQHPAVGDVDVVELDVAAILQRGIDRPEVRGQGGVGELVVQPVVPVGAADQPQVLVDEGGLEVPVGALGDHIAELQVRQVEGADDAGVAALHPLAD
jgi:hypothetical protein